jgi:hypothetical protein
VRVVVVSRSPSGAVFTSLLSCGGETKCNWGPENEIVKAAFRFYNFFAFAMSIEEEEEESHQLARTPES